MLPVEERLLRLEDQLEIYQLVAGCSYAVDAGEGELLSRGFTEKGVYAIGDGPVYEGRPALAALPEGNGAQALRAMGSAHVTPLPHVRIEGDRAVATCHALLVMHRDGFRVAGLGACRFEFSRSPQVGWKIERRQTYALDGDPRALSLLGRLDDV